MPEIETDEERAAFESALDTVAAAGWPLDDGAYRVVWCAARDWALGEDERQRSATEVYESEHRERMERHQLAMHPERNPSSIFYDPEG